MNRVHHTPVGLTKDVGWEIGMRKTVDVSPQEAWDCLFSEDGLRLWLGDVPNLRLEEGASYQTKDGTTGEIRVFNPGGHIRLTWQPKGWDHASLLQIRVNPSGRKTTIAFHQEHLASAIEREEMRQRWQSVLKALEPLLLRD